ncbi:MAG: hypothetical protein IJ598_00790 [Ruminococcus sp.]|nr:hypothetical protein [Ruminococcus sp.]
MKTWHKIVLIVLAVFLGLPFFCVIPDLLLILRNLLSSIPPFNTIIQTSIQPDKYITVIMNPFFSLGAIIISLFALSISKSSAKNQNMNKQASIIKAASTIKESIEKNTTVIFEIKSSSGNINDLVVNDDLNKDASILVGTQRISYDEYIYYMSFMNTVRDIKKCTDDKRQESACDFCKEYLKHNKATCNDKLNDLISKLQSIEKEEV